MNDNWIFVTEGLPKESNRPHKEKLYIATEKYGCFTGFYDNGKFMHNYALEIKDVIAWQKLPKAPLLKK